MTLDISVADLCRRMADALPTHPANDESSDLASSYEVIGLLVHAFVSAGQFELLGFDQDKPLAECQTLRPRLPPQWNNGFGSLSFVYRHVPSNARIVVRVDRIGANVEVRGLAVAGGSVYRVERPTRDLVNSSALPIRITMNGDAEDRSDLADKIKAALASENAVQDLLRAIQTDILQPLIPSLQNQPNPEAQTARQFYNNRRPERPEQSDDPTSALRDDDPAILGIQDPRPQASIPPPAADFPPPGFEDEHQMIRPPQHINPPATSPFNIGHDDLNPPGLGPHDPLRGSFVGGGLPRPGGGSGMHPTFDDPLFTGQGGFGSGQAGSGGYDPQAPPGARWDPLGPGDNPRFPGPGSGRGNNPFGGSGGGFGGGFGGHII